MKAFIERIIQRLDYLSRTAYISLVLVSVVSISILYVLIIRTTNRLDDQQKVLEQQVERTRRAIIYACETTTVVRALTQTTLTLLRSQPQTPARLQTIATFEQLLIPLQDNEACREVQENP